MKKYGDTVLFQRGSTTVNALVLQSSIQEDGEHLTIVYLDPALASPILGGSAAQQAIATAFATPLVEGKAQGWTNSESSDDAGFVAALMPHLIALSGEVAKVDPKADISPDGTLQSAAKIIGQIPEMQVNFADESAAELNRTHEQQERADGLQQEVERLIGENANLRGHIETLNAGKLEDARAAEQKASEAPTEPAQ